MIWSDLLDVNLQLLVDYQPPSQLPINFAQASLYFAACSGVKVIAEQARFNNSSEGKINGFSAKAGVEGDELAVKVKDVTLYVPLNSTEIRSGRIVFGVRPEKVKIVDQGKTGLPKNQINGSIKLTAFVGVSTQYEVITNWGQEISAFEQNIDPSDLGRPGQAVTLAWEPRHTFVLDPDQDLTAGLDTSWDE